MKLIITIVFIINGLIKLDAQPLRIAILDFDNISGIAKYDGLGKAMSSMLISDIESNVSPRRLQLVERAQINKIMKEQNLQKSTSFDKNTSVKMGKLLGVNFLLIGDIYILDNSLIINARLTDASSGDIKFSVKQEGKINEWLTVKSKLGKSVSTSISMPFTQPRIPDGTISTAVLTIYASAIDENDKGNFEKAETLINTAKEFDPGFGYLDDLRDEVERIKKDIQKINTKVDALVTDPVSTALDFLNISNYDAAIEVVDKALSNIREDDLYKNNKIIFLLNTKVEILTQKKDFISAGVVVDSISRIEPLFIDGLMNAIILNCQTKNYDKVDSIYQFIIKNKNLFFSEELKKQSKLIYRTNGWGYTVKSGFQDNSKNCEDLFMYFEFSNFILEAISSDKNASNELIKHWIDNSINDLTEDIALSYLFFMKPFHFMRSNSNVLWSIVKYNNGRINKDYFILCQKFVSYYDTGDTTIDLHNLNIFKDKFPIDYKYIMNLSGWKTDDPYFPEIRYKDVFRKSWDFLNFQLNIAHVLFINGQKVEAQKIYCTLIELFDKEFLRTYELNGIENFRQVILNDWQDLGIGAGSEYLICK